MQGVERYKVSLASHDTSWENEFQATKDELIKILADNVIGIHHFGSTAIKHIVAKPILDVAAVVKDIPSVIEKMESAGYEYRGEQGIPGRHYFVMRRNLNNITVTTHHIHCYLSYCENLTNALLFCRFMNENPEYAKQYNDLKIELAAKFPDDRVAYSDGKQNFIVQAIDTARTLYSDK